MENELLKTAQSRPEDVAAMIKELKGNIMTIK